MVMEKMHNASNSIFSKIIFALISVAFVVSGMAGYMVATADTSAVKINGEEISQQAFQQQYNDEYQRLSQQLGAQFSAVADTPEFSEGLRKSVLNRLIDQELLRQYVTDLKLAASDTYVKQEIVTTPAFQADGKFDNNAYQQILRANNMTADMYAEYVREALRLDQLQSGLAGTVLMLPAQQEEFAKLFFQKRTFRLAKLPLTAEMAKQTVTDQEVADYYNANKSAFMVPELVKVQYLDITRAAAEKAVKVTDVEIQQYYQDNKAQFVSKAQDRLAHIQFAKETDALDAYQALQNGADFAALAKEKSLDKPSAVNGGELGWLNAGDLPKAFEEAAAALQIGQYSQPVKVDNQYHIIKLEDRKAPKAQSLEEVKDLIASQIRQDLLNNQFYSLEKQVAEKAFEDQSSLEAAAKVAGVEIKETDYFSRKDIPAALNFPSVASAIFDGDISQGNQNSEPMNVADQHSIVVRVVDHKAEGTKSLEEAKAEITAYLKRQKAETVMLEQANKTVEELNQGKQPALNFAAAETWVYAENKDPALNNAIFSMAKPEQDKTTYAAAKADNGDVVIVALTAVENGEVSAEQGAQFTAQVMQAEQTDLQANLLKSLRNKAKIEVNEEFMKQSQD
ncbi:peptidylprolyl isomerase [Basfia succiniciproducens]|uniref:Periplasmic chaperone PpiD n=1 Tax=Basfia succiniciproducens TaxID=653940 RepID=A0A1G5DY10_9PAST|nr:peptidylprolyl isomerase [Basfia succiniciproducens]QIM69040.1 peptidylprolyl isomerase [Basfia succiniciproducens]SCY19517.1 peptidyl-prolyl cis-trans isomerase D [Basfia succiniciproducens]